MYINNSTLFDLMKFTVLQKVEGKIQLTNQDKYHVSTDETSPCIMFECLSEVSARNVFDAKT